MLPQRTPLQCDSMIHLCRGHCLLGAPCQQLDEHRLTLYDSLLWRTWCLSFLLTGIFENNKLDREAEFVQRCHVHQRNFPRFLELLVAKFGHVLLVRWIQSSRHTELVLWRFLHIHFIHQTEYFHRLKMLVVVFGCRLLVYQVKFHYRLHWILVSSLISCLSLGLKVLNVWTGLAECTLLQLIIQRIVRSEASYRCSTTSLTLKARLTITGARPENNTS